MSVDEALEILKRRRLTLLEHASLSLDDLAELEKELRETTFVRKPYESPKVKEVSGSEVLGNLFKMAESIEGQKLESYRAKLKEHFRSSTKTSFGLGDILDGIDKVES